MSREPRNGAIVRLRPAQRATGASGRLVWDIWTDTPECAACGSPWVRLKTCRDRGAVLQPTDEEGVMRQLRAMRDAVNAVVAFRARPADVDRLLDMGKAIDHRDRAFGVDGVCPETRAFGPDCQAWQRVQDAMYRAALRRLESKKP